MPTRLRPTAPIAPDAILVGDPGRALLLAQELLEQPKMSNHARGLWGYSGQTPAGDALTIQATGMGGPSAALVLGELAELGVRRAVRIGTCTGLDAACTPGELLLVTEAMAEAASTASLGIAAGAAVSPDAGLTDSLGLELASIGRAASIASYDAMPEDLPAPAEVAAADMQTASLLARAHALGVAAAALLIVTETPGSSSLADAELEEAAKRAGRAAVTVLSG